MEPQGSASLCLLSHAHGDDEHFAAKPGFLRGHPGSERTSSCEEGTLPSKPSPWLHKQQRIFQKNKVLGGSVVHIHTVGELRQEDGHEFKTSLGYIVRSCLKKLTVEPGSGGACL